MEAPRDAATCCRSRHRQLRRLGSRELLNPRLDRRQFCRAFALDVRHLTPRPAAGGKFLPIPHIEGWSFLAFSGTIVGEGLIVHTLFWGDPIMARRNRPAFTLVELLVVIVIISMLVGMLVPAVNSARARARQAQCTNNQHEISLGMLQYENSHTRFPGYINKMGTGAINTSNRQMPLSWMTVLLPHIGRSDLWGEWRTQTTSATLAAPRVVRLQQAICPSDTAKRDDVGSLSYVVNCGVEDGRQNDIARGGARNESASDGVFFNLYGYAVSATAWNVLTTPRATASSIQDGASNTLMLSENTQARTWYADPNRTDRHAVEPYLGFVWRWTHTGDNPTTEPFNFLSAGAQGTLQINTRREDTVPDLTASFDVTAPYYYARPSSPHPGGVVVSYCDGHQQFLSQAIQYDTLRHLMTPNSLDALNATFSGDNELRD